MKVSHDRRTRSVRDDLFEHWIALICLIIISYSALLIAIIYRSEMSNAYSIIKHRNQAVNFFIEGYFSKIRNEVLLLSNIQEVIEAPYLGPKARKKTLKLYRTIEEIDPDINYVYSGYKNGLLLINNYTPPKGFDPTVRPWYKAALRTAPNASNGIPYREIKTKEWLVSISRVLIDKHGKIKGVVSIDTSINTVANLLKQHIERYKSLYSFVIKPNGIILIHHDKSLLNKRLSDITNSSIDLTKSSGLFSYTSNGSKKLGCYSTIKKLGWIIVTIVDKEEVLTPMISKILLSMLIVIIIAIATSWFFSSSLSKKIIVPLTELRKRVSTITTSEGDISPNYNYPNNEIGEIASDIEQLTERELYLKNIELKKMNRQLELLSTTDHLTKLMNRHKMTDELKKEWNRAKRYKTTFSLILFDIDHFKKINDTYGHQAGDLVLAEMASLVKNTLRTTDIISRWGGEEFLVLCPGTNLQSAASLAQRLKTSIEQHRFSIDSRVTISLGVYEFTNQEEDIEEMLSKADQKLYEAKRLGRNCVVC